MHNRTSGKWPPDRALQHGPEASALSSSQARISRCILKVPDTQISGHGIPYESRHASDFLLTPHQKPYRHVGMTSSCSSSHTIDKLGHCCFRLSKLVCKGLRGTCNCFWDLLGATVLRNTPVRVCVCVCVCVGCVCVCARVCVCVCFLKTGDPGRAPSTCFAQFFLENTPKAISENSKNMY